MTMGVSTQRVRRWREYRDWAETLRWLISEIGLDDLFADAKATVAPKGAELMGPSVRISLPPGGGNGLVLETRAVYGTDKRLVSERHEVPYVKLQGLDGAPCKEVLRLVGSMLLDWYRHLLVQDWRVAATEPVKVEPVKKEKKA